MNPSSNLRLAAFTLLLLTTAAPLHAQAPIGVNAAIRNRVQMKTGADPALRNAVIREAVHLNDLVVSGPQSALQILLRDKTVFTLGSNARMTIDRFVYDPNRASSDVAVSVAKGAFRFMSGPTLKGAGKNAINTPVGSIGVRGTIVLGAVGEDVAAVLAGEPGIPPPPPNLANATLVLLVGPGSGNQGFDRIGAIDANFGDRTISIEKGGYALLVWDNGQAPFGPFLISETALNRLLALLSLTASENQGPPPPPSDLPIPAPTNDEPSRPEVPIAGTFGQTPGGPLPPPPPPPVDRPPVTPPVVTPPVVTPPVVTPPVVTPPVVTPPVVTPPVVTPPVVTPPVDRPPTVVLGPGQQLIDIPGLGPTVVFISPPDPPDYRPPSPNYPGPCGP